MKKFMVITATALVIVLFQYCNNQSNNSNKNETVTENSAPSPISPVPLPNPNIPGFTFPEDSNLLNTWIKNNDSSKIALHGWGLWTALGMNSGQTYNGEQLKVFETWFTPEDISSATLSKEENKSFAPEKMQTVRRSKLSIPHQFVHAREMQTFNLESNVPPEDSSRILGFVKYDPSAALFTINNKLYNSTILEAMIKDGKMDIPDFPNTAMALKPVFEIITKSSLVNGYFNLKVWNGPPPKPIGYPESKWPGCVYVDPTNQGQGNGSIDIGCKGRTPQTTYNVDDFIHFKLDKQTAADLRNIMKISSATEGDVAILVAMHVTSREIKRWTWQTYWWAPNPDTPPFPSTSYTASIRPQQLSGAARHYAMSIGYTFINPDQPFTGGNNIGKSLYVFNPYLEAGFVPNTFYQPAIVITNGKPVTNSFGVQTNCMSCHALANFNPGNSVPTGPGYMADTYIDMQGPGFKNVLKTDFLWSIPQNATSSNTNFTLLMKNSHVPKKTKH